MTDGINDIWREHRPYLTDLAFRMLGSIHDAEDVVQETFTRLLRADLAEIEDLRGWLIVVASRLCLDQLRSAARRRAGGPDVERNSPPAADPADRITLDDNVRMALYVMLEQLSPPERAVFVLHDVFGFPFAEVATIVGRSPAASRQIASRARRRIRAEASGGRFQPDAEQQHRVAAEFIAACAGGDVTELVQLLDPDVVGDVDLGPGFPVPRPQRGSARVATNLLGYFGAATGTTLVSSPVNGVLAFRGGELVGVLTFSMRDGRIHDIHATADPAKLTFVAGP